MSEWYEPPLQFFSFCNKTPICHYNGQIVRPDCTQQNEVVFHQMILFVGTTNWLFPWFDNYLGLNDENWLFNLKCNSFHKSRSQFDSKWFSQMGYIAWDQNVGLLIMDILTILSLLQYRIGQTKPIDTLSHSTKNIVCLFLLPSLHVWWWCWCLLRVCSSLNHAICQG